MVETRAQRAKHRTRVLWGWVEAEDDVFSNILSRLPVRSLHSLRTENKYWYKTISKKYLAKMHLARSRKNPLFIIICPTTDESMKVYTMEPGSFQLMDLSTINPPWRIEKELMYMISAFNGLVCCINRKVADIQCQYFDLQIWINNPCTGENLLLPQGTPSFRFEPGIGVAYRSEISEYKVFRIFCPGETHLFREWHCEVYSSNTGTWKHIGPVPCARIYFRFSPFRSHVFAGGKVYWLSYMYPPDQILSVDWEERFESIPLPNLKEERMYN